MALLTWKTSRTQLHSATDETVELPAGFPVAGRTSTRAFVEFSSRSGNMVPEPCDYVVRLEARLGHRKKWFKLMTFTLHASHVTQPEEYVAYSNDPEAVPTDQKKAASRALKELAEAYSKPAPASTS